LIDNVAASLPRQMAAYSRHYIKLTHCNAFLWMVRDRVIGEVIGDRPSWHLLHFGIEAYKSASGSKSRDFRFVIRD
jgi:hypothetical protein